MARANPLLPPTGYRRKCARCRVDRHDRCVGMEECGCDDPSHSWQLEPEPEPVLNPTHYLPDPMRPLEVRLVTDEPTTDTRTHLATDPGDTHNVAELAEDDTVIVGMSVGLYKQVAEAARLQDREVDVVLRRALEHYLICRRGRCPHTHDEVPVE